MDDIERKIKFFEETHKDKTPYYIDEKGNVKQGPMKYPRCMLCNKDLEKIRKYNPRCRVIKFCSDRCRKEHNRRTQIRDKQGGWLIWNTHEGRKPHFRNEMRVIYQKGKNPIEIPFKAKKGKKYYA